MRHIQGKQRGHLLTVFGKTIVTVRAMSFDHQVQKTCAQRAGGLILLRDGKSRETLLLLSTLRFHLSSDNLDTC